jgi:hypothetical protein
VRRGHVAIVISVGLLVGAWVVVAATRGSAAAPVSQGDAHLSGDVWVMPESQVAAFLREHGVADPSPNPYPTGTAVVGRVSWAAHRGGAGDRFTILLGDRRGGAGAIRQVLGPPERDVTLGSGSMWDGTTSAHDWLRGSGAVQHDGGYTSFGQFASVPTTWSGDVWYVGQVLDVQGRNPVPTSDASPVVGVALSTSDRVWWVRRLASA